MNEKISVIIPIYNAKEYIEKCILSVINQTYKNIEVIAIIDGSTDNSEDIVDKYVKMDSRIKKISRENKGALFTRLEGINKSSSNYIMFVDSDDYILPSMLEDMMNVQKENMSDIVRCGYIKEYTNENLKLYNKITDEGLKMYDKSNFATELFPIFRDTYNCNQMYSQIIRKDLVIDMPNKLLEETNIKIGEDLVFNIETYKNAKKIVFVNECYYVYVSNNESITSKKTIESARKDIKESIYVYGKLEELRKHWNIEDNISEELIKKRIAKEVIVQFNSLFRIKGMPKEKKIIITETKKLLKQDKVYSYLNLYNKLILSFFSSAVLFFKTAEINISIFIKKIGKRVLGIITNLTGGKNEKNRDNDISKFK